MIDFLSRDDIQFKLLGLIVFNCGIICYKEYRRRTTYREKIDEVSKASIYEFDQFKKQVHKLTSSNKPNKVPKEQPKTFFVKMTPKNTLFITHEENIYSNQIYFCPPSMNRIWKNVLKTYEKESKTQSISLKEVQKNKNLLFQGKILTDKISCETIYKPKLPPSFEPDSHRLVILKNLVLNQFQQIYGVCLYGLQYVLEKLKFRKNQKRSYDQKRSPLIKGIFAGTLFTHFSFLAGSNFLLKVNLQGSQISTEFIADNKLAIIDYYTSRISISNKFTVFATIIMTGALGFMIYRLRPWLKIYWRYLTSKTYKKLNPSGVSDDKLCQICYVNCRNVVFQRCRHIVVCEECFYHLEQSKCIICNEAIEKKQIVYPESS